jgi:hypothetical protein
MFYNGPAIFLLIAGCLFIILSKRIVTANLSFRADAPPKNHIYKTHCIWSLRFGGIIGIIVAFSILTWGPSTSKMNKDSNKILLLEQGKIINGQVHKLSYKRSGWAVVYKFEANEPASSQKKIYWGASYGPKTYYTPAGGVINVIYSPSNPRINYEIKSFLNNPSYRYAFKKAGKLELLDKYRDKYQLEEYSFDEWWKLQERK